MSSSSPSKKPKKILNDPSDAVSEFVHGMLLQFPNRLVKLQHHHVLLHRPSLDDQKNNNHSGAVVKIVSGGGSGHEPSHAGWLGEGMLSGAVLGGMFASPSVAAVLDAIRALSSSNDNNENNKGVLLVVKNYTGDRLNFGMACERANQESNTTTVEMVVVADDCALPREKGITGARGVAGTVLVHKVAGAAAFHFRQSLAQVKELAQETCRRLSSLGVALDAVTVPGAAATNDRLENENTMELGLGIHGEAGMKQVQVMTADKLVKEMLSTMQAHGRVQEGEEKTIVPLLQPQDDVCLLVNNLGGTSNFEMSILAQAAVKELETTYQCHVSRLLVGSYMTSFNMHGASLTVLNLTGAPDLLVQCLDAPTDAPAWIPCDVRQGKDAPRPSLQELAVEQPSSTTSPTTSSGIATTLPPDWNHDQAVRCITAATAALIDAEPLLTKYDTIVGDGDCGTTMKRGASYILDLVQQDKLRTHHPSYLTADLAQAISDSMGGTSGVLLELCFRKMSSTLSSNSSIVSLAEAFQAGVEAVSLYGGATVGARTMLDALVPAANALVETKNLALAASKAREGANATAIMKAASAGRSNYLSEETLLGTPDPGAVAVAVVLEALAAEASSKKD